MPEPVACEPYACAHCGTRLQWIVSFESGRGRLTVVEFESSERHRCPKRRRPSPLRLRPEPSPADPFEGAVRAIREMHHDQTALMRASLAQIGQIAEDARDALVATDELLKQLRPSHASHREPPDEAPDTRPVTRTGAVQL
jgi:hypothetical protein